MASVNWTASTGGTWNTPGSWSNNADPQTGDDVSINTPNSSITVTYTTGSLNLDSLYTGSNDTLDVTGGTLATQGNGYKLYGALDISGGTMRLVGSTFGNGLGGLIGNNLTQSGGTLHFVNDSTIQNGIFAQSAGTMVIDHGALNDQDATGTIGGAISGAGEFILSGGGTTALAAGAGIATGAFSIQNGTTLFLEEKLSYARQFSLSGTLDLNGNTVSLAGHDTLQGDINGGSVTLSGTGHIGGLTLENGATLDITSTINQTANLQLGGNTGTGTISVAAGATLRVTGNDAVSQGNSAGLLVNAGTIIKTGGGLVAGAMVISDALTSTGTITAAVGMIDFNGPGNGVESTITGTLQGAGSLAFTNGDYILGGAAGLALDSHRLEFTGNTSSTNVTIASALSYGGIWEQSGGLLLFENNLTLSGTTDFAGGELKGTATITDSGPLALGNGMQLEGNLTFILNGNVDQTGGVNFGDISDSVDQATLTAGHTWDLEGSSSINGAFGTITNLGTFVKENGASNDQVSSNLFNTGAILVESGTLSLSGNGTLAGTVGGAGVLDVSGQFAFANGLALSVGELILDSQGNDVQATLGGNLAFANIYAQEGGTLALANNTLTLSGTTSLDGGAILGSGELLVTGQAVIGNFTLAEGGDMQFNAATEQDGNLLLTSGSTAPTLSIGPKGVYTLDNGAAIGGSNNSIVGTVSVAGTLLAGGASTGTIAASIVDTGTIQISHGQMAFLGPLTGKGEVLLTAGGTLDLANNFATSTGITFGDRRRQYLPANPGRLHRHHRRLRHRRQRRTERLRLPGRHPHLPHRDQ